VDEGVCGTRWNDASVLGTPFMLAENKAVIAALLRLHTRSNLHGCSDSFKVCRDTGQVASIEGIKDVRDLAVSDVEHQSGNRRRQAIDWLTDNGLRFVGLCFVAGETRGFARGNGLVTHYHASRKPRRSRRHQCIVRKLFSHHNTLHSHRTLGYRFPDKQPHHCTVNHKGRVRFLRGDKTHARPDQSAISWFRGNPNHPYL
jgi:hypothetical protein